MYEADDLLMVLLHGLWGLQLSDDDLRAALDRAGEPAREIAAGLVSPAAREYFRIRRAWKDHSERELERGRAHGIEWIHFGSPDYPRFWRTLSRAPLVFSCRGARSWNSQSYLSVVGSRAPTKETEVWMKRELGSFLRRHDVGIVSGGARGVDQLAHRLAVEAGRPTICIQPAGLLNPYPFGHEDLWNMIVDGGGCLISTFGLNEPLRKWAFAVRNRWIAGLSGGCFVVEANRRSGSSLTARHARDEGRELCTLPVFPHSSQGLGNLDLILDGATPLRDAADLLTFWNRVRASIPRGFQTANGEH